MSRITIKIINEQTTISANGIKEVWVYPISKLTRSYGLAFSDDNWEKRTILTSNDLGSLHLKRRAIEAALHFNASTVNI